MPAKSPTGSHFLGLELCPEQLRAVVVDEHLDVLVAEQVDFDTDLPEYQTHGGVFTTPGGDAYTSPVDMWIKALDLLLQKLRTRTDLSKILAISGSAHPSTILFTPSATAALSSLVQHPHQSLHAILGTSSALALLHTPSPHDASTAQHASSIEAAFGGPDTMAARVGTPAHAALPAAQLMKIREGAPEAWSRAGKVLLASTALASILLGSWAPVGEAEAAGTGMWETEKRGWSELVLEVVSGSKEGAKKLGEMLGGVESDGGRSLGTVSRYFVERFGFDKDATIHPFTSSHLATYLSLVPTSSDALLSFGATDALLCAAPDPARASRIHALLPHPAQDPSEPRRWIAMLSSRNADVPRALVRDMYTKSWSAFDRLVAIVPPGGSIGLDDKLFSFWVLQGESYPFSHPHTSKGIFRFENGIKVNEFRDLRANPRCLLESQLLGFRVRFGRMTVGSGASYPARPNSSNANTSNGYGYTNGHVKSVKEATDPSTLPFNPYSSTHLPRRLFATGTAAHFPSIVNLLGDIFDAPVFVPTTVVEAAAIAPGIPNPPGAANIPSRAALGGAYLARWARGVGVVGKKGTFEEDIRWILGKRWAQTQQQQAQNGRWGIPGSAGNTIGKSRGSGLAATALVEEDEDEANASGNPTFQYATEDTTNTLGHSTTSSLASLSTSTSTSQSASTLPTTLSIPSNPLLSSSSLPTATPTTAAPLTPIAALQTDDADAQFGLVKVAEPDTDAFLGYAAMVPEFVRLEGLVVRGLV